MANSLQFGPNPLLAAIQRPAPVATVNAAGAAPLPSVPTGQSAVPVATPAAAALNFQPDGMADFLLGRANRGTPINTGVNLLGRLAALGVGRKIQKENEAGQKDAIEAAITSLPPEVQAAARIAALSGDPSKILPVLQQQATIAAQAAGREDSQAHESEQLDKRLTATKEQNEANLKQRQSEQKSLEAHRSASLAVQARNADIAERRANIAAQEANQPDYKEANKLQDDFRKESQVFREQADAMRRIEASTEDASPAGDLALIFNYMKMLDPGSTVREGEFATASNSASVPERLRGLYNQTIEGTRLTDSQRTDFVNRAGRIFKRSLESHQDREEEFTKLGSRRGVPAEDFMVDYAGELRDFTPATPPTSGELDAINQEIQALEQELGVGNPE